MTQVSVSGASLSAATSTLSPTRSTSGSTQSASTTGTGMPGKQDFLKLLVAEMTHQDPMKPMDSMSSITQLAQFNALEQMQQMNKSIESFSATQAIMEAASLLGKTVAYRANSNRSDSYLVGQVYSVSWDTGTPILNVDNKEVGLSQIVGVK